MQCPAGFELGVYGTCVASCPPEFKFLREWGGGADIKEQCVHRLQNNKAIRLVPLPVPQPGTLPSPAFAQEQDRVANEAVRIRAEVERDIAKTRFRNDASDVKRQYVNEFSKIQSQYADFKSVSAAAKDIRDTKAALKVMRPPTAPSSDLEKERREISDISKRNLFFVQVALALVVASLVGYLVLPIEYAHMIGFLLLCVGISVGFFLRRG